MRLVSAVLVLVLVVNGTAWAQTIEANGEVFDAQSLVGTVNNDGDPNPRRPRSKSLAYAGLLAMFTGIAMVGPWGKTYSILGDQYCVTDYAVDYGPCFAHGKQAAVGLGLIGGGLVMIWQGMELVDKQPRVQVGAAVSKAEVGVAAHVRW